MVTRVAATPQSAYNQRLLQIANTSKVGLFMTGCAVAGALFGRFVSPGKGLALVGAAALGIAYRWQTRKDPFIPKDTAPIVSSYLDDAADVRGFATYFFGYQPNSSDLVMRAGMSSTVLALLKEEAAHLVRVYRNPESFTLDKYFDPISGGLLIEMIRLVKKHHPDLPQSDLEKMAKDLLKDALYDHVITYLAKSIESELLSKKTGESLKITAAFLDSLILEIAKKTGREPKYIKAHLLREFEKECPKGVQALKNDSRLSRALLLHPAYQLFCEQEIKRMIEEDKTRGKSALWEARMNGGEMTQAFGVDVLPEETVGDYCGRILQMISQMQREVEDLEKRLGEIPQGPSDQDSADVTKLRALRSRIHVLTALIEDHYPTYKSDIDRKMENELTLRELRKAARDRLQQRVDLVEFLCPERALSAEEPPAQPCMEGFSEDNLTVIGSHLDSLVDIDAFSGFVASQRGKESGSRVANAAAEDAVLEQIAAEMALIDLTQAADPVDAFGKLQSDNHTAVKRLANLLMQLSERSEAKPLSSKIPQTKVDFKECIARAKVFLKKGGYAVVAGIIGRDVSYRITESLSERVCARLANDPGGAQRLHLDSDGIKAQLARVAEIAGKTQDEVVADVRAACVVGSGDLLIAKWQCSPEYERRSDALASIQDYLRTSKQALAGNDNPSVVANRALDQELDVTRNLIQLLARSKPEQYPGGSGGSAPIGAN
jgi:hypothetical protein